MKYKIELTTMHDVEEFTALVQQVDCDVRLIGKDEHGSGWELSAKSTLCVFLLGGHIQHIGVHVRGHAAAVIRRAQTKRLLFHNKLLYSRIKTSD